MWAAQKRIPYIMLATEMEPTRQAFQLYHDTAAELGYESGPQNIGYLWKVHVDETEELAEQAGRKYVQGPSNPFLAGNEGTVNPALVDLPGLTSRTRVLPTQAVATQAGAWRRGQRLRAPLRKADQRLHHYLGHAEDGPAEDPARPGVHPTRQYLLLGRRRRHDPR